MCHLTRGNQPRSAGASGHRQGWSPFCNRLNGVGKSSIFEAVHFAIYGNVPRLKALQDAEQGDSYVVNRFHPGQQATIDLNRSGFAGGSNS
ncbi:ATP-binding protein [Tistrella bauzanensis]|uniref:ATP-binding protein n=1 Tax=Tistrella bauzanensis TaxID=657419 RepID=UPI003558BE1F